MSSASSLSSVDLRFSVILAGVTVFAITAKPRKIGKAMQTYMCVACAHTVCACMYVIKIQSNTHAGKITSQRVCDA